MAALATLLCLSACGGGGGGGGGTAGTTPSLALDKTTLTFASADSAAPPDAQTVTATFTGAALAVGTLPGTTLPTWLSVSASTSSASPVTITISIVGVQLAPGRNSTTLRFATGNADGSGVVYRDVAVTYTIDHTVTPSALTLVSTVSAVAASTGTLQLTTAGADWKASSDQPWLKVSPSSGNGSATLTVSATAGSLAAGNYSATVTVTDTLTNRSRTATISLSVDPRRLAVLERGVALTLTTGTSRLMHAVPVIDTAGLAGHWAASSDSSWLSVGPANGSAGSALTLTADPTGMADGLYYATVTVSPDSEPGLSNTATIRVGLYIDQTSAAPPDLLTSGDIGGAADIVADPIRPYVYVSNVIFDSVANVFNGAVTAYNVYTGQAVTQLAFPGKILDKLAVSPDGSQLLVVNTTDAVIQPMSLQGTSIVAGVPWTGMRLLTGTTSLAFTQVSGSDVVLSGERQVLSPLSGAVLSEFQGTDPNLSLYGAYVAAAPDGRSAYLMALSGGNHLLAHISLSNPTGSVAAVAIGEINETNDSGGLAFSRDGNHLITVSSSPLEPGNNVLVYDAAAFTLTNGVEVGIAMQGWLDVTSSGDIFVTDDQNSITSFDANLAQTGKRSFGQVAGVTGLGRVSSDEQRAVVRLNGSGIVQLQFFSSTLPP